MLRVPVFCSRACACFLLFATVERGILRLTSDSRLQQQSNGLFDIVFTATSGAVYWAGVSVLSKSNATHASTSQGRCCRQESRRIETFAPANLSACCTTKRRSMGRHITRGLALRPFHPTPPRPSPHAALLHHGPGLQPINASLNLLHAHHLDVHIPTKDAARRPKSRPNSTEAMAGDGKLNLDELQQLLRIMDLAQGREAWLLAKELMQTLDDDGTGLVDRHEFFRDMKTNKVDSKGDLEDFADFEDPAAAREEYRLSVIMKRKERKGRKADRAMQSIYGAKEGKFFANRLRQAQGRRPKAELPAA